MTTVLHLPSRADAPIACDMTTAVDTPAERLAEYARLFEASLARRERRDASVVFVFRSSAGTSELVAELARREAACCPFMEYRVETSGDELIYTITGAARDGVGAMLDAMYALPESPRSGWPAHVADIEVDVAGRREQRRVDEQPAHVDA